MEFSYVGKKRQPSLYSHNLFGEVEFDGDYETKYSIEYHEVEITFGIDVNNGEVTNVELVGIYIEFQPKVKTLLSSFPH